MLPLNSEILDRLPPQDMEAERNLLGSVLLQPALLDDLWASVKDSDFYADAHRRLWMNLLALRDAGVGIDATTIANRLKTTEELETIGGVAYLAQLLQSVPVYHHAHYYAAIVARHAKARAIIHACTDGLHDAWDPGMDPDQTVDRIEVAMGAIGERTASREPRMVSEIVPEAMGKIEQAKNAEQGRGVLTGFWHFDTTIGGLFPGELIVLAARPGIGKTSLACQIVHHAALKRGLTYFASLEMGQLEIATRMICTLGGVSSRRIRTSKIRDEDYRALARGGIEVGRVPLAIHDPPGLTAHEMRRACRRLVRGGLVLAAVDYLQLLTPDDRREKRYEQIGRLTKDLKATARELAIPVLVMCQLNREAEKEKRRPRLSDLRDSGEIEQDADVVMFLHRETPKAEAPPTTETELIVAKNRNGPKGTLKLEWNAELTRYSEPQAENYETAFDQYAGSDEF